MRLLRKASLAAFVLCLCIVLLTFSNGYLKARLNTEESITFTTQTVPSELSSLRDVLTHQKRATFTRGGTFHNPKTVVALDVPADQASEREAMVSLLEALRAEGGGDFTWFETIHSDSEV